MKQSFFILLLLSLLCTGCRDENKGWENLSSLEDSRWKLEGIVDETGTLKELELGSELGQIENREKCYTLVFDTDSTFLTFTPANDFFGGYIVDYETYSFQVTEFGGTKVGEIGDADLYSDLFWHGHIQSFSVSENELRLYYDNRKNHLLYKLWKP